MKFKFLILILFLSSCAANFYDKESNAYSSKGFALIYEEKIDIKDKKNKISNIFNSNKLAAAHINLKPGTLIKLTNPENKTSINTKIFFNYNYPDFYKVSINKKIAEKLNLDLKAPFIELNVVKKNKSFVAEKAKTFNEEKKIHSKAPVEVVTIDILNKSNVKYNKKSKKRKSFSILIANFFSIDSAKNLKIRLAKELPFLDNKKIKIIKINQNNYELISGRYKSMNLLKNDYIELKKFGFEDLDLKIYE